MALGLDSGIFLTFLVINILVGLYSARGVQTIKEYAVGDGKFSSMVIASTLVATWIGGSTFTNKISEVYASGLYYIWASLGGVVFFFIIGYFFAPRMSEFIGKLSIASAMGDLFGNKVRLVTAFFGCIASVGIIAAQLKVAGMLMEYGFGLPAHYGILVSGILIGVYSSLGGIRSVTFTDVIQLLTFGTIIPTLSFVIFSSLKSNDVLLHTIQHNPLFDYREVFDFTRAKSFGYLLLFVCYACPGFNPAIFQRVAMASNTLQIKKSFNLAGIASLFIFASLCFIGFVVLSDNPNLVPKDVTKYIFTHYSYVGLRGLIIAGIMAMIMSTADSYINSTSVLISHDIFGSLKIKFMNNELKSAKIISILITSFALILALNSSGSLLKFMISTRSFYEPLIGVSFIFAILGFRSSSKSVLISMGLAFLTVSILTIIKHDEIQTFMTAMVVSTTSLFTSHYLLKQPGGWVGIKDMGPLISARQLRKHNFEQFIKNVKNFTIISF